MSNEDTVVGYVRVSTDDQGLNGSSLEGQRQAIAEECERRGWALVRIEEDVQSAKSMRKRPGLQRALSAVESDEAGALVVAKLDRLSRSLIDFATLVERSRKRGWQIVVLDLAVDTTTPNGEAMAGMLAVFAQWERRMIGQRTREALAVKRRQGVKMGRPRALPERTIRRMRSARRRGLSYAEIAAKLDADGVPTAHGGRQWHAATVRSALAARSRKSGRT